MTTFALSCAVCCYIGETVQNQFRTIKAILYEREPSQLQMRAFSVHLQDSLNKDKHLRTLISSVPEITFMAKRLSIPLAPAQTTMFGGYDCLLDIRGYWLPCYSQPMASHSCGWSLVPTETAVIRKRSVGKT